MVDKCQSPLAKRITGRYAYAVNGTPGGDIHLYRGKTYCFNVIQPTDHGGQYYSHFYFTRDPVGGPSNACGDENNLAPPINGSPDPIGSGAVYITIDEYWPKRFWYQSRNFCFMGGMVFVHG
jgi:hypothetical protein